MSASDEIDEMHLTPGGWVQGSQKLDFSGWKHREPPADRLLSVRFREYLSSSFSKMELTADETRYGTDVDILAALEEHGPDPHPSAERFYGWHEFLKSVGYSRASR